MLRKLRRAATITGAAAALAVAAGAITPALAATAQHQTTVTRSHSTPTAATPALPGDCDYFFDTGNQKYANDALDLPTGWLSFGSQQDGWTYCNESDRHRNGFFEIWANNNTGCLAPSQLQADTAVHLDTPRACENYNLWDDWSATDVGIYHNQIMWVFQNAYTGACLYDNGQTPAITTSCAAYRTDAFMHFVWDPLY